MSSAVMRTLMFFRLFSGSMEGSRLSEVCIQDVCEGKSSADCAKKIDNEDVRCRNRLLFANVV